MVQPLILSFLTLALLNTLTKSQLIYNFCEISSNYTANSTYETNLYNLFNSLSKKTSKTGFYMGTEGDVPNRVYGLALCRGDISDDSCTGCVMMASRYFPQLCPYTKSGIAWYDRCVVRYSNYKFFSQLDDGIPGQNGCLYLNASDPSQFKKKVVNMIQSLSQIAAFNRSVRMFATGNDTGLYGMVQCTRDLSGDECFTCLNQTLYGLFDQCDGSVQVTAVRGNCIVRYDMEQFFDSDPTWDAPPDPDPTIIQPVHNPPPPGRRKKGNCNTYKILCILMMGLHLEFSICTNHCHYDLYSVGF